MPYKFRRGFYQPPQGGKGIGGFQHRYVTVIDEQSVDTETDSAMNMTKDVLQGNTLNEEVDIPIHNKKRKLDPPKRESKKPKLDLKSFVKKHQSVKF